MLIDFLLQPMNLLPLGVAAYFQLQYLKNRSAGTDRIPLTRRLKELQRKRALVPILPLSGLFGTVWGLIDVLSYMGLKSDNLADEMSTIISKFAPCFTTTLIGIFFAGIYMYAYASKIAELEDILEEKTEAETEDNTVSEIEEKAESGNEEK